jgi:hypothetical protein
MAEQRKNPYPRKNFSIVADYLEEIALILGKERGLEPINDENGYEDVKINGREAISLKVPENAVSASIYVEAEEPTKSKDIIIRFKENGDKPTSKSGQALEHKAILKPVGKNILDSLKFIGIEEKKKHTLRVQYYQSVQVVLTENE